MRSSNQKSFTKLCSKNDRIYFENTIKNLMEKSKQQNLEFTYYFLEKALESLPQFNK